MAPPRKSGAERPHVRLSRAILEALNALAATQHRTRDAQIRAALTEYLEAPSSNPAPASGADLVELRVRLAPELAVSLDELEGDREAHLAEAIRRAIGARHCSTLNISFLSDEAISHGG